MKKPEIEARYFMGWREYVFRGSVDKAREVALAEIFEHAGGVASAAYKITDKVFLHYEGEISRLKKALSDLLESARDLIQKTDASTEYPLYWLEKELKAIRAAISRVEGE